MFVVILARFGLFLALGCQCSWAAVPRVTQLRLETSVDVPSSPYPIFSGDEVTFNVHITHTSTSQTHAVDVLLQLEIPFYLKLLNYGHGTGLEWTSVDKSEPSILKFKFKHIHGTKSVTLSMLIAVDPHYTANRHGDHNVAALADLWYFGKDDSSSRHLDNARHERGLLPVKFVSTTACEKRIQVNESRYFASSVQSVDENNAAIFVDSGVWLTADSLKREKNQFLHLDLGRLMRVSKVATRGQSTPQVAFVRTFHLYHSKNSIEWSATHENNKIKEFQANTDGTNVAFNFMPSLTHARYLRIVARSWKGRQALRVDVFGCNVHPNEDIVNYCPIFDFENGITGWEKTGTAFDNQPTIGDNYKERKGKSANIQGKAWIATAEDRVQSFIPAGSAQGDTPVGTLTSPKFLIAASKLYFLIGGTANNTDVRAELVVDGKSVRKASGDGDEMKEVTWFVKNFRGKEAVLRLVDDSAVGHLNFDAFRVDCHLDADAQDIALPSRAAMLNTKTHNFYVCDSSHLRRKDVPICRMTNGANGRWIDLPGILGVLGVDLSTNTLYAVSKDYHLITSSRPDGGGWQYFKRSEWNEAKEKISMVKMTSLPWITVQDNVSPKVLKKFTDSNGDEWSAATRGINFKPVGGTSVEIAVWTCQVFEVVDDPCFSEPCENGANCTAITRDVYNCSCVPGYSGVNCETDIDECLTVSCLNGGTCLHGIDFYFCRCPVGFSGDYCENASPTCQTSPCLNGGTCQDQTPPAFLCSCTSNYKGTHCEIEIDRCVDHTCGNDGACVPTDGGYECVCPYGFSGARCNTVLRSNFEVLATKMVTEANSYLVIKARIPSHGMSLTENWCRDYEKLCSYRDGRDATGFGRSYNHIHEHASCQEKYQSVMDRADVLGAKPNEKVAALAKRAGFAAATSNNSFAFNACDGEKCSRVLPGSGCDEALTCISRSVPDRVVYTVCIQPNANYRANRKEWHVIKGIRHLMLKVKSPKAYSVHATWCKDYELLCDRYGLRALGVRKDTGCIKNYRAVIHENISPSDLQSCFGPGKSFRFSDCSSCSSYSRNTYRALDHFRYHYYDYATACTQPHNVGFKVLDDQKLLNHSGKDYMAVKVQVPLDGKSNATSWCKDYELLCGSYDMAPLGCDGCHSQYEPSFSSCPISGNKVQQILHNAGFSNATSSNTFIYQSCGTCSDHVVENECGNNNLFCIDRDNSYRMFYTICGEKPKKGVLRVKASRSVVYKSVPFKVLKLHELPSSGQPLLSNWCEEYQTICESVGNVPVGCGPSDLSDPDIATCGKTYGAQMDNDGLLCGDNSVILDLVQKSGFYSNARNTFMFYKCSPEACAKPVTYNCNADCSCHPALSCVSNEMRSYSRETYAVCSGYTSTFEVLETKNSTYKQHEVLVVQAKIPSDGIAKLGNWCEEYKMLCYYYGYRPTGCGVEFANSINYASCRTDYESIMPKDNVYGCPATIKIAFIAKAAGFLGVTPSNSFGFSDCQATCVSTLTANGPFIDLSVADGIVYTICETSDSHFKVMSTKKSVYKGGEYLFVQALVPPDLISKHDTWCTDYERMCESFGLKPVARSGRQTLSRYATCRKRHGPVNPKLTEATHRDAIITFGEDFLGYYNVPYYGTFVFGEDCDVRCFNDLNEYYQSYSLYELRGSDLDNYDYQVYSVCASSDSNFHVLSTKTIKYGEDYLVIQAKLPSNYESKYENWCRDYERLCRSFRKRPTGCGLSYQRSAKHRACVDKYQSAMAKGDPVGCNSSQIVASIAVAAGYLSANENNSFVFHQCLHECPKKLSKESCPDSLPCLTSRSDVVYTLCTDSSSAFEVERMLPTREENTPLLFITATLNGVVEAKSGDWCTDYQKLCESYASRPVGCYSRKASDDISACTKDYNAVPVQNDAQRCGDDGENDIYRMTTLTPESPDGAMFKCHGCKASDCQKSLSSTCNGALNCLKQVDWVYTMCSRASHNFQIVDTNTTSHEKLGDDVLVIRASVPQDGQSLYENWCEDYTKLCSMYGKRPLACPLLYNYTAMYPESSCRACAKDYNGYMINPKNSTPSLSCPMNDLISSIAKDAGFSKASPLNTLGLTTCLRCSKTLQMVNSDEPYISMSCPPGAECTPLQDAGSDVYMLCANPQVSTFHINEIRYVQHGGRKFAAIRVSLPHGTMSQFGDWCLDYQKVCESISMRPIACGSYYEKTRLRRMCRSKYNAVMLGEFGCPNYGKIAEISRAAGFHYDEGRAFALNECDKCGADVYASSGGLDRISTTHGFWYSACTYSDSNFEELQTRKVVINRKSFLIVKAQLPVDMVSSHETWCKDYQMMCESYAKRPLTCSDRADLQTNYNALFLDHNCDTLSSIPKQAGFVHATDDNTLVFASYTRGKCSRKFPRANGPFGSLNTSVAHREVYAVCRGSATAFGVVAKKSRMASGRSYLFLQVTMPKDGTASYRNWCEDYAQLCREYGMTPVTCGQPSCAQIYGAVYEPTSASNVCPDTKLLSLARNAGIGSTTDKTTFLFSFACYTLNCKKVVGTRACGNKNIPHCFDRNRNHGEFTTVCATPTEKTRFPTLDVKFVEYSGRRYTIIRTQKTHKESFQANWCHDYKTLCQSFSQRPLACPTAYNVNPELHLCQRHYAAVSMESNEQGCPMNAFVAELAQHAGFTRATSQNSFAFQNCDGKYCKKQLPSGECNEALHCLNMVGEQDDLYTACTESDSAFSVSAVRLNVAYNSEVYGVIRVYVWDGQQSAHQDWCKDYQRLCESYSMEAVQCKKPGIELASDTCTNNYGAHQRLESCFEDAKNIATKANLGPVYHKTTLVMNGCNSCPTVVTKTCSSGLDCLRASTLFAVCARTKYVDAFQPVQTRFINYGHRTYLLIQSLLRASEVRSFKTSYNAFCETIYGYQPIACGRRDRNNDDRMSACPTAFPNSMSHDGNDFTCPPANMISYLARKTGFYHSADENTFAFYMCSASASYSRYGGHYLSSSSCYTRLSCLKSGQYLSLTYTMCAVPSPSKSLGFHVLDQKQVMFLGIKYVALKVLVGSSGNSATENWCFDYLELCRKYKMVPTGCGTTKKNEPGYLKCSSTYRSFMSHGISEFCTKPLPSSLVRRAGFPDAAKENTFVFNDCSKCVKTLIPGTCNPALDCLHSKMVNLHAYTLCVEQKSGFEYIAKKKTIYGGVEYLVVKSALPVDNRPVYDNWCVDYQKLCYSVGAFPVACSLAPGVHDVRRFAEKYGAITVDSLPCPPIARILAIVKKAGYKTAKSGNSFAFTGFSSYECSKNLPEIHCTPGLDCLDSKSQEVFAVCINPTNFAVSDVRRARFSGNTFTVIQAKLPISGLSKTATWCEEYATLCRSMKQQPIICPGLAQAAYYDKCRDSYGGYLFLDEYSCNNESDTLHDIAKTVGFPEANHPNTFGFRSCAACRRELHSGPGCDPSLDCVNNQTTGSDVFAICVKESKNTSFQVLETKEVMTAEVQYLVVKAAVSPFGKSKYDTWCTDYERMCSSLEMRPVRCSSDDGNPCPLLYTALVPEKQFKCENNADLVQFVKNAGFTQALQNNTFIYGACSTSGKCRKTLPTDQCDGSMNCLKKPSGARVFFTLCARSRLTNFKYLDSRLHNFYGAQYFVIKAGVFSRESKGMNWCYDYRDMCASFGKQPVISGSFGEHWNGDRQQCFPGYNATSSIKHYHDYHTAVSQISMPQSSCRVVYKDCKSCVKTFQHCPFDNCNCDFFYVFCL